MWETGSRRGICLGDRIDATFAYMAYNSIILIQMRKLRFILLLLIVSVPMWGQVDRKEVRRGNREFRKGEYEAAFEDYLRAVEKDTSSIAANYNMASALYRMEKYDQALNGS